jgi:16S rRNA G966 N2-methylase RsmD
MPPTEWYRRGVRLLARTTVEAVRDKLGEMIGRDVASIIQNTAAVTTFAVIDPFAGSCNGLYWILRNVGNSKGLGFEMDQSIFEMTKRNISALDRPINLLQGDYKALLDTHRFPSNHFIIAFLAPPWGDALNETKGLDLRRTKPPIADIIDDFERIYKDNRILYVTQVHQNIEPLSLENLKKRFDWSDLRIYDINVEGMRHGILLGLNRWMPR